MLRSLDCARDDIRERDDGERKRERRNFWVCFCGNGIFGFGVFCFAGFMGFGRNEVREREGPKQH